MQSAALLVLVTALLNQPQNTRVFESTDGLLTVTSLFKSRSTTRSVKLKLVEFLYFYLLPEAPAQTSRSEPNTAVGLKRQGSMLGDEDSERRMNTADRSLLDSSFIRDAVEDEMATDSTRGTEEKQRLLGQYLTNVDSLVQDLQESQPFGGMPAPVAVG